MGLAAAGAYIEEVRTLRQLTRQQVAEMIDLSHDQILRFEKGRSSLSGPALLKLIQAVGASFEETTRLLNGDEVTVEDARECGRAWVARTNVHGGQDLSTEEQIAELLAIALQRTGGNMAAVRRLLLRALDTALDE